MKKLNELGTNQPAEPKLTQDEIAALPRIGEIATEMQELNEKIRIYLEEHPYVSK